MLDDLDRLGSGAVVPPDGVVHEREIRPRRRLRWWQTLPIAVTGILGSLMFAFPLAFESGDGGAVVGMLGLLLTAASVGWGAMAAHRVGYTWPGLPRRDSGRRAGWRVIAAYTVVGVVLIALAVWRVARLRG
jgi:protein-S-isoprenylcysteine O-methyltransferase Ste14